jgi:hypothetical protein
MPRALLRAAALAGLAVGLVLVAAAAQALLIQTPLHLTADRSEAQAGDDVQFRVAPSNESARAAWQGRAVRVVWEVVDTGEGAEGSGAPAGGLVREELALDGRAEAAFAWAIPAAADDQNIFVVLQDREGGDDRLGQVHLRIGDAPYVAFFMGGPADATAATGDVNDTAQGPPSRAPTPGPAVVAILGVLVAVAVLAAWRKP